MIKTLREMNGLSTVYHRPYEDIILFLFVCHVIFLGYIFYNHASGLHPNKCGSPKSPVSWHISFNLSDVRLSLKTTEIPTGWRWQDLLSDKKLKPPLYLAEWEALACDGLAWMFLSPKSLRCPSPNPPWVRSHIRHDREYIWVPIVRFFS